MENQNSDVLLKEIKKGAITLENCLAVSFHLKSKIHLPCDPEIPLLNIYPRVMKRYVNTMTYM